MMAAGYAQREMRGHSVMALLRKNRLMATPYVFGIVQKENDRAVLLNRIAQVSSFFALFFEVFNSAIVSKGCHSHMAPAS